jgi:hypothetical protein
MKPGLVNKREKIIWNFDNVQKAHATRGYEAKGLVNKIVCN